MKDKKRDHGIYLYNEYSPKQQICTCDTLITRKGQSYVCYSYIGIMPIKLTDEIVLNLKIAYKIIFNFSLYLTCTQMYLYTYQ